MTSWSGTLGDALEVLIDHRGKTPRKLGGDWTPDGVPVYSAVHVKNGRLDGEGARRIPVEMFERWMPVRLKEGDVLLTSEAPLGETALVPTSAPACLGQRLFALRGKPGLLESRYLYYLLQHLPVRNQILSRASGTTVSGIRQEELARVRVDLPSVEEQSEIAATLGAMDTKIESNRRRAETAEALLDLLGDTSATSLVPLANLVEVDRAVCEPAAEGDRHVDHYSIPAYDERRLPALTPGTTIRSQKLVVRGESVLVSRLNPRTNRTWFAVPTPGVLAAASTEFLVLRARPGLSLGALWLAVRAEWFCTELARRATGTSGSHQRVRPDDALSIEVPDVRRLDPGVAAEANGLLRIAHQARIESQTLAELRDLLLPELLSGHMRVDPARELSETATA